MKSSSENRIPSLDGLRAISILLVVGSHASYNLGFPDHYNIGYLGVRVFFVISGFLITTLLIAELQKTEKINLAKFYFRRTFRIFPAYYFYLLVILLLSIIGILNISLAKFLPAFTYTSNYFPVSEWNLGHSWSLSVEEQFYLIYPGVLLLLGMRKTIWLLFALLFICPLVRIIDYRLLGHLDLVSTFYGFHANVDTLAIGCLLAFMRSGLHQNRYYLKVLNSKWMLLAPFVIVWATTQVERPHLYFGVLISLCNVLIALCLDWAITNYQNNTIGNALNSKPLVLIGMMSYSIYLWQQPFFNPKTAHWFTAFPISFLGVIICSCFSYFIIEKYSLHLRQVWEKRLFKPSETKVDNSASPLALQHEAVKV